MLSDVRLHADYKCFNKSTEEALLKLREWSASFGFPMTLVSDSGPAFRNRFEEECAKLGVRVEHSSAYNPSSMSEVQRSVGSLKHLLKRTANINQLQLSEMVFSLNSRVQLNDTGSPIAKFYGRDVWGSLPNCLNRNLNWNYLMENRRKIT